MVRFNTITFIAIVAFLLSSVISTPIPVVATPDINERDINGLRSRGLGGLFGGVFKSVGGFGFKSLAKGAVKGGAKGDNNFQGKMTETRLREWQARLERWQARLRLWAARLRMEKALEVQKEKNFKLANPSFQNSQNNPSQNFRPSQNLNPSQNFHQNNPSQNFNQNNPSQNDNPQSDSDS